MKINEKDVKDIYALVREHELGNGKPETIDLSRIETVCAADWGWYRTVTMTLDKVGAMAPRYLDGSDLAVVQGRLGHLRQAVEAAPKSLLWKLRARVGESVRWYELPEDAPRAFDQ